MTFQFVGFLLTYLLHTTHAARCGSRAGLGVTLIQYGFYLRTRASEIAEGKIIDGGFSGNGVAVSPGAGSAGGWFAEELEPTESGARRRRGWISRMVQPSQPTAEGGATLADLFAAQADGQPVNVGDQNLTDSMSQSTEWLAYVLMVIGWTLLLSSMLSYWRIYRWGKSLVDAARREEASNNASTEETTGTSPDAGGATGLINRFRAVLGSRGGSGNGTGEDWIISLALVTDLALIPHRDVDRGQEAVEEAEATTQEEEQGRASTILHLSPIWRTKMDWILKMPI